MTCNQWPALMAYIHDRNTLLTSAAWCAQLRKDEVEAHGGAFADVVADLQAAKAAYAETRKAVGQSDYPYNSDMGRFLGLELRPNNEPGHGYYMACKVQDAYEYGQARRKVEAAIAQGKTLKIVAARDKATRRPIRFHTFAGNQIKIVGTTVECVNERRRVRLSSNWSEASCMEAVCRALQTGAAYGEGL